MNPIKRTSLALLLAATAAVLAGCSDDADSNEASTTSATSATTSTTATTSSGNGGSGGAGGGGGHGGASAEPAVVAAFDPALGELPEGLAVLDGKAYVGFAPKSEIVSVALAGAPAVSSFGSAPVPPPNAGFLTGLAFDGGGALYAALVSFDPGTQAGIYKIAPGGGAAVAFATDPGMVFPNGLAFDAGGDLLVTDSAAGAVLRISPAGDVSPWASDPVLTGQKDFCGPGLGSFDIGANGIAVGAAGARYGATNPHASSVGVPVLAGGAAGAPEIVAGPDCDALGGADGLVVDADGSLLVALNRLNRIVRVGAGGSVTVVAEGGVLDFPASLAIADVGGERSLLVTSFALATASAGRAAHPALVAMPLPAP